ncbi:16S rRNA (cytosine(1402)-N(4))-methyltransferase RsmH [Litoribrevibacter albus]|uniref:Ribosomal RNA small subunit methyltransferase H n=1 Tax=Litoribrevibacter albus TaxID=1473156 RepID=A0AA37SBR1_9GAMM|nr:16S rRNA (cytosine(1402)-N(4))-methyltransferase RsmH [Litoribrevibacter albus]GLQ33247.1 ribosomal RNA small subunit methyltransferase H [Litoribrevibacter albus]
MNETGFKHKTVLLDEAVELLIQRPDGVYVDGTFGRGGHSRLILSQLTGSGTLIGFDKDPEAIAAANSLCAEDDRFEIEHASFASLLEVMKRRDLVGKVSGVLVDLGVSSPQLDDADRGFSFLKSGPLDMRMNPSAGQSAADWVNTADEADIARVLWEYGEERFSRRIARAIVARRQEKEILDTLDLANLISASVPKKDKFKHPATRSFQAIRIHVNNELGDLEELLSQSLEVLEPGGSLVVISFHSLEDRIVKRFMKEQAKGKPLPKGLPVTDDQISRTMKLACKASKPGDQEVKENPRARSAVLRAAIKL